MAAIDSYRMGLRATVRGYWTRVMDLGQFHDIMRSVITRRLTQAFTEGAALCGVVPDEFTTNEWIALSNAIDEELGHIGDLAVWIDQLRPEFPTRPKEPPPKVFSRIDKWLGRLQDLRSQAQQLVCKDAKLLWVLNPQKENCRDCKRLDKQVRRASRWKAADLRPYSNKLD